MNFLFLHMWCCLPSLFISSLRSLVLPVHIKSLPLVEAQELQQWLLRPLCKLPQPRGQGKHASWEKNNNSNRSNVQTHCHFIVFITFPIRVRTGHGKPGKSWSLSVLVFRPGKSWNLIDGHGKSCVVHKLLQVSKQGQNKIQASFVRKYPKTRMILTNFESGS